MIEEEEEEEEEEEKIWMMKKFNRDKHKNQL